MLPPLPPAGRAARTLAALLLLAPACRDPVPAGEAAPPPPAADFVIAAGDSAFWVTSAAGSVQVRGAPIELARLDDRFYELYVADDDRSYEDATFVGQRVYRRDILRGDSVLVYEDTLVPHLAEEYARLHPADRPVAPDAESAEQPLWSATSTLDLTDIHGSFVSFELHTDVERDDAPRWHTSRRGVLDLRGQGLVPLAAIAGSPGATADVERRRGEVLRAALDSVRGRASAQGTRAAAALGFYRLDPASFALTTVDGAPAIAYALVGTGDGDAGLLLPLAPIRIEEPAWWSAVIATLPTGSANGGRDVWRHRGYEVVVRYDSAEGPARLALRDSTSREWMIARIPGPATRVFWLDAPSIDSASRLALARAFDESTLYDEAVRTASNRVRPAARRHRRPAHGAVPHRPHPRERTLLPHA